MDEGQRLTISKLMEIVVMSDRRDICRSSNRATRTSETFRPALFCHLFTNVGARRSLAGDGTGTEPKNGYTLSLVPARQRVHNGWIPRNDRGFAPQVEA